MITINTTREKLYAIGIDLGGTFIKAGIVSSSGKILKQMKVRSYSEIGPEKVISQIDYCISGLRRSAYLMISGIGVGAPGIVQDGVVKYPPNFCNWDEVDLKKCLEDSHNMEVIIDNDANCAGLAELKFGYGKSFKDFLFLTLGTGIGGAIIINGNIYRGETNGAGEFGMMTINYLGPEFIAGNRGAVEAYIGRNYFLKRNRSKIKKLGKDVDFNMISYYASRGRKPALDLMKQYGFYLGIGIVNFFNLMDVHTAVLGGGISQAYRFFIDECRTTIRKRSLKTIRNNFRVLKSRLGNKAGILGAASLILD
jgi:glucokinase